MKNEIIMVSRFKHLLQNLNISAAEFADKIGVQRSSVSHVLSGRNKPSIDFLEKILHTFPEIDSGWLITGTGNWKKSEVQPQITAASDKNPDQNIREEHEEVKAMDTPDNEIKTPALDQEGPVDHIIVVYKDSTFKILRPKA